MLESFALRVREFRLWAGNPSPGAAGCRETLTRLTALYSAALELPPFWDKSPSEDFKDSELDEKEVQRVVNAISQNLPIQFYWLMFEPHEQPPEEPVAASLSQEIGEIYSDVVEGLLVYESGGAEEALFEWGESFHTHWGRHAVSAIHAIH
ncbi:MAG: DUF5063 domain-containing protein, partial [Acidobacteria bacterium]